MVKWGFMNPFKPTAGKMPPELIGRDAIVEAFVDGMDNGPGAPERLMRPTELKSYRSRLIKENVVESRARGEIEFAIPYMADYLNAHRADLLDEMGL